MERFPLCLSTQRLGIRCLCLYPLLMPGLGHAESLLHSLRKYDLNDYALGIGVGAGQSPYVDTEGSTYFYPYLTSLEDSTLTKSWLVTEDAGLGGRYLSADGAWEIGAQGRVQTLGFGPDTGPALAGVESRGWTVEGGAMVGWRGWPVQVKLKHFWELLSRHSGTTSELRFSYPVDLASGYVVPYLTLIRQSSRYTDHYFGISAAESTADRAVYKPDAALNLKLGVRWGYRLTPDWLLSGGVGVTFYDETITDSPIVNRDQTASMTLGVAYNRGLFRRFQPQEEGPRLPRWEFSVAYVDARIDSVQRVDADSRSYGDRVDQEDIFDLDDRDKLTTARLVWRIGHYHHFDIEHLQIQRSGTIIPTEPVRFGDTQIVADETLRTESRLLLSRVSYGYSFVRDAQKEFGISVGVHVPQFETRGEQRSSGASWKVEASAPLPVIGAHTYFALRAKLGIRVRAQLFGLQMDRFEGTMTMLESSLEYTPVPRLALMLGWVGYRLNLEAADDDFQGRVKVEYRGPQIAASVRF